MNIYSFFPLIGGVSACFLGIIVLVKNINSRLNQIFSLFIFSVVIWLFASFMMLSSATEGAAIFWDKIVYVAVAFTPVLFYHFTLLFTENLKKKKVFVYLGYFISFVFSILSTTDYFIEGLYKYNWGVHAQARPLHTIFLAFFAFYIILTFLNIYFFQKKAAGIQKSQANYMLLAFFIITITSFAFLPAYGVDIIFPFPYFTAFLCVLVLFLAIVKYHLLGIRVITTELFIIIIWVMSAVKIFFSGGTQDLFVNIGLFIAIFFVGILLIRSVLKEIRQKEQIEKLAKEIQRAYEVEKRAKEQTEKAYELEKQAKEQTKKAYELEKKANEELKKIDEYKNRFLRQAQHDLKTPLTVIAWYSDMVAGGHYGKAPKAAMDIVKRIGVVSRDKIKDVNNFLDLEQFKIGKGVVSLKPGIEILPILEEIIKAISPNAESKGIYLKLENPEKPFMVSADKEKLKAAIFNIIDNAVKYTEKGGVIIKIFNSQFSIFNDENKNLTPNTQNPTSKIIIEVRDTGIGIPKEKIKNMFEEQFLRTEKAEKTAEGSGVGLFLSCQIIKLHNGKVWAESEGEGKGSTFCIELPAE